MNLNADLANFMLTAVLSFLTGLELKAYKIKFHENSSESFFGTARTYTFTGILGFVLYKIDPVNVVVYAIGFISITALYLLFFRQLLDKGKHSIVLYLVLMLVYSLGPLSILYSLWVPSLLFVSILFVLNAKSRLLDFASGINTYEFETLGKMILLSAVILPLLPDDSKIPYVGISFYKIWLTVVVISGISYAGYLVQKYLFPSRGLFLTGLIGGTYSSTASTVVLAKKARMAPGNPMITAAIISATGMMYIRLLVIAFVFNPQIAKIVLAPFLFFILLSALATFYYYRAGTKISNEPVTEDSNPLELGTAFVFAGLFVLMMMVTHVVVLNYGAGGLKLLSLIVGFTDIDPFILSLLTGHYVIGSQQVAAAIIIAAGSNNVLKALYALWFGSRERTLASFVWLALLGGLTIACGALMAAWPASVACSLQQGIGQAFQGLLALGLPGPETGVQG